MRRAGILAMAALVAAGACGKSSEEKKEEKKEQQAAKTAETGAAEAAKGLEQMAKGLEAMAGGVAAGNVQPVDPVSFRDMQALFPEFDGWQKGKPTGERMSAPSSSRRRKSSTKGDSRVELKMVDSGSTSCSSHHTRCS